MLLKQTYFYYNIFNFTNINLPSNLHIEKDNS